MEWIDPAAQAPITTFSLMDANSVLRDETQISPEVTPEVVLGWYKNMLTGEHFAAFLALAKNKVNGSSIVNILDSIMFDAQRHGRLSFYMMSHGEEALMVGSAAALTAEDVVTTQYREHGVFLQRGFTLKDFMSQLAANKNDPGKGRNMPVHYSGKSKVNIHAVASNLGTQIAHATGAAYALKMMDLEEDASKPRRVAAAYFGEGAASEGDFHGALNFAATQECPVIFICRNNGFAISTPASQQYRGDGIASRGVGYGIEALRVDGTDIFAVYEATKEARCRAVEGRPILLELMSYRISHHSTSDDSSAYRDRAEVSLWKGTKLNPIDRTCKWLESKGVWSKEQDAQIKRDIRRSVIQELTIAEKEKKPALSAVFDDVYAELTEEAQAQKEELKRIMEKYPAEYDCDQHEGGIDGL
ncbi:hypothetical protein FOVSG1_006634 [Fusarium oxysporum f. sp. vasinfectum]